MSDAALLKSFDIPVIAVNNGYEYAPDAALLYACDAKWWEQYRHKGVKGGPGWESFKGLKVTMEAPQDPSIMRVGNGGAWGFDDRPDHVRTGKNSGCQAAHIAAHAGAARILLIGCDCRHGDDGRAHEFGEHEWMASRRPRDMNIFIEGWRLLAPELARRGIEVVNCAAGSALDYFPKRDLQEILCAIY